MMLLDGAASRDHKRRAVAGAQVARALSVVGWLVVIGLFAGVALNVIGAHVAAGGVGWA